MPKVINGKGANKLRGKAAKLEEIRAACNADIVSGIDVGAKHYSLDENDQINITNLALFAAQGSTVLYHADGELCRPYTPEEFMEVASAATARKVYATTYHNHLKAWVNEAEEAELSAIHYGAQLPDNLAASLSALLGGG
jgi:hypothetical protein